MADRRFRSHSRTLEIRLGPSTLQSKKSPGMAASDGGSPVTVCGSLDRSIRLDASDDSIWELPIV